VHNYEYRDFSACITSCFSLLKYAPDWHVKPRNVPGELIMSSLVRQTIACGVLAVAVATASAQTTQPSQPSSRPAVVVVKVAPLEADICTDAVDPYNSPAERARFFQAAGQDNELSAAEFAAALLPGRRPG
jgi:hypothetical protein